MANAPACPIILSAEELRRKVLGIPYEDGLIFSVIFIKRTNGEVRKMVCRRGVKSYLKGGELGYSAKDNNLLNVFDMEKQAYRSINCETIIELCLHGQIYRKIGE